VAANNGLALERVVVGGGCGIEEGVKTEGGRGAKGKMTRGRGEKEER
jgi:hypothetical protein